MNGRRMFALLLAALAIIGLALWLAGREPGHTSRVGEPVLPALQANLNAVREIRLGKGDGSAVTLRRRDTDWEVAQRGYTADSGKVRKLLLDLAALAVRAEKTSEPANYSRLGVEDADIPTAGSVAVAVAAAEQNWQLLVGKQDSPRAGFVRVPDQAVSLLAEPLIIVELDPKRWLDRQLLDRAATSVRSVTVIPLEGPAYTVQRDNAGQADMTLADMPPKAKLAAPGAANSAADALAGLAFDDVRKPDSTTNGKTGRATFAFFDNGTLTIAGRREGEQSYLSIISASDPALAARSKGWEYEVPGWKFDQLFKARDAILAR
ncbi:MAG TPA: DUF4340 domain-containing protein [Steroidobacteraceae bacterium]|nr:DUF4340 domain-containing protein [Steroidobacteraceae bacterium]